MIPTYTFDEFRRRQDECAKHGVSMFAGTPLPAYAAFGQMTDEIDRKVKEEKRKETERRNMRWFCPKCGRTDPRHPNTFPHELPSHHTPLGQGSCLWTPKERLCDGKRVAQNFNGKEWVNL